MSTFENVPWNHTRFVVVDIEGNGRKPPDLVELGVVVLDAHQIMSSQVWLVKPEQSITYNVTKIHGISNKDVRNVPTFDSIKDEIKAVIRDDYIIAHYAKVDYNVLSRKLPSWQPKAVIDTWRLSRKILPGLDSYSLGNLIRLFSLESVLSQLNLKAHRANYDALATAHVFLHLVQHNRQKTMSIDDILSIAQIDIQPRQYRLL